MSVTESTADYSSLVTVTYSVRRGAREPSRWTPGSEVHPGFSSVRRVHVYGVTI